MREDFLHHIWKFKKLNTLELKTTNSETVTILSTGAQNPNAGPDFFNAQLIINHQKWAGNVEIHVKSSDWYLHSHELDANYDTVILHVVWEHDVEVFRKNNTKIPTLELKSYVKKEVLSNYEKLAPNKDKWINCENHFKHVDSFLVQNWLERLYIERLQEKSLIINAMLQQSSNNWEAVLFWLLAKSFGLKVNGDAFLSIAQSVDFSVVRKTQSKRESLEALLFGQSQLLDDYTIEEPYYLQLQKEYQFLKQKFNLSNSNTLKPSFFRLRPLNFPTIRLSQLASLYHFESNLFSKLMQIRELSEFYTVFKVTSSSFWETHYTFEKVSKPVKKQLTQTFVNLLLINTVIPLQFAYAKALGKNNTDDVLKRIQEIKAEKNNIVDKFMTLNQFKASALTSQGVLQLKNNYCDNHKCLDCAVGNIVIAH